MLLIGCGDQVPLIGGVLVLLVGNAGIAAPAQYGPVAAKVGVIFGTITICNVLVVAHTPGLAVGVKV